MYDAGKIITLLVIGLALLGFPFWWNHGKAAPTPELELTPKAKAAKECIEPKPFMREQHMQLLDTWRDAVVRGQPTTVLWWNVPGELEVGAGAEVFFWTIPGKPEVGAGAEKPVGTRYYQTSRGEKVYMSLQTTCLDCHSNKTKFCDRCHNYLGVTPFCWDCHVAPEEKK